MKLYRRFFSLAASTIMVFAPVGTIIRAGQQPPPQAQAQMFDQYVARVREQLALSEEQVVSLRQLLSTHSTRLGEVRRRSQAQAYSLQLISDISFDSLFD